MQKFSETVYANLFWLISGLLVWLVILPIALICVPLILLTAAGKKFFQILQPKLTEPERASQTNPESKSANALRALLTSLLLTTLVEVPAVLAAVISLQPLRAIKGELILTQMLQPPPVQSQAKSSRDTLEVSAEEKTSGTWDG